MRAGTTDRQAAVDRLTRHFTDGRLDAGEFDERVGKAYAATHLDELPVLFADLPENESHTGYGPGIRRPPGDGAGSFPAAPPWSGPYRTHYHRPPRFLVAVVLLALLFSICAVTHGFFPFPLIWIGFVLLFVSMRGRHRRWAAENPGRNRG
jgi:hypothetical protein